MKLNEKKTEAAGNEDYETQESDVKRQKMQQQTKAWLKIQSEKREDTNKITYRRCIGEERRHKQQSRLPEKCKQYHI